MAGFFRLSPPALPDTSASTAGFLPDRLTAADSLVASAVEQEGVPGAVLLIARGGRIALRKAYGSAGLRPVKRPAQIDTIYDLASCTKPVATATSVMQLVESGCVSLDTPVARYLPPLRSTSDEKPWITVRHLLTHASGLPGGIATGSRKFTTEEMTAFIAERARLRFPPGAKFLYSDLNAILLGAIVETVSGLSLDSYSRRNVFEPLGMDDTGFRPQGNRALRCASVSSGDDLPARRGHVHDPTAAALNGISGNAGLYSTVNDLARFCQMLLQEGSYGGVRILRPETVRLMTSPQSTFSPVAEGSRGLGWDIDTPYAIRGDLPRGSFGHTGFTGTSVWIDPRTQTFIVLLTNAVHADPKIESMVARRVIRLRKQVSSIVASAIPELGLPPYDPGAVRPPAS